MSALIQEDINVYLVWVLSADILTDQAAHHLMSHQFSLPSSWPAASRVEINLYFLSESLSITSPCNFPVHATLSSSRCRWQSCWRLLSTSPTCSSARTFVIRTSRPARAATFSVLSWQSFKLDRLTHVAGNCLYTVTGSITWWRLGAQWEWRLILAIFQVRYTGYRDRPIHERQNKFLNAARDGSTEIVSTIFIILTIKIELKSPVTGLVLVVLLTYQTNCCNFCEKNFI